MQFFQCILSNFNGFRFHFDYYVRMAHSKKKQQFISQIHRFFEMLAKRAYSFYFSDFLRITPNWHVIMENVQKIGLHRAVRMEDIDLLVKWLFKSCVDKQKQKMLEHVEDCIKFKLIEQIKEVFLL